MDFCMEMSFPRQAPQKYGHLLAHILSLYCSLDLTLALTVLDSEILVIKVVQSCFLKTPSFRFLIFQIDQVLRLVFRQLFFGLNSNRKAVQKPHRLMVSLDRWSVALASDLTGLAYLISKHLMVTVCFPCLAEVVSHSKNVANHSFETCQPFQIRRHLRRSVNYLLIKVHLVELHYIYCSLWLSTQVVSLPISQSSWSRSLSLSLLHGSWEHPLSASTSSP